MYLKNSKSNIEGIMKNHLMSVSKAVKTDK